MTRSKCRLHRNAIQSKFTRSIPNGWMTLGWNVLLRCSRGESTKGTTIGLGQWLLCIYVLGTLIGSPLLPPKGKLPA